MREINTRHVIWRRCFVVGALNDKRWSQATRGILLVLVLYMCWYYNYTYIIIHVISFMVKAYIIIPFAKYEYLKAGNRYG